MTRTRLDYAPYIERDIRFLRIHDCNGHQLKVYSVVYGTAKLKQPVFDAALAVCGAVVPEPDILAGRPGLGFVIFHQGKTADYLVLCWWDRENELPTRVFIRDDEQWRPAQDGESFCVWDLQIIWFERYAYIETVLVGSHRASRTEYLSRLYG